jgi:hypothetical protein
MPLLPAHAGTPAGNDRVVLLRWWSRSERIVRYRCSKPSRKAQVFRFSLNGLQQNTIGFLMVANGFVVPEGRSSAVGSNRVIGIQRTFRLCGFGQIPSESGHVGLCSHDRILVIPAHALVGNDLHIGNKNGGRLTGLLGLLQRGGSSQRGFLFFVTETGVVRMGQPERSEHTPGAIGDYSCQAHSWRPPLFPKQPLHHFIDVRHVLTQAFAGLAVPRWPSTRLTLPRVLFQFLYVRHIHPCPSWPPYHF